MESSYLLSGSTDGLVNTYNIDITDEDDALAEVMNHGASISHTGFLSDTTIYALSHDETLSLYHLDRHNDDDDIIPPLVFGDLRPKANCQYVVDILTSSEGTLVGAGSHRFVYNTTHSVFQYAHQASSEHRLDLIPLDAKSQWAFNEGETIRLAGAHGEDIVRSICVDAQVCIERKALFVMHDAHEYSQAPFTLVVKMAL